jgi:hypothetical protein
MLPDEKHARTQPALLVGTHSSFIDTTRFSSYWKLICMTAWIFRFKQSLLCRERLQGELNAAELAVPIGFRLYKRNASFSSFTHFRTMNPYQKNPKLLVSTPS